MYTICIQNVQCAKYLIEEQLLEKSVECDVVQSATLTYLKNSHLGTGCFRLGCFAKTKLPYSDFIL